MIAFEYGLYVTIEQVDDVYPLPLEHKFNKVWAYRVLGIHSASETSEAYFILPNNVNQIWFISTRHCRYHGIIKDDDSHMIVTDDKVW